VCHPPVTIPQHVDAPLIQRPHISALFLHMTMLMRFPPSACSHTPSLNSLFRFSSFVSQKKKHTHTGLLRPPLLLLLLLPHRLWHPPQPPTAARALPPPPSRGLSFLPLLLLFLRLLPYHFLPSTHPSLALLPSPPLLPPLHPHALPPSPPLRPRQGSSPPTTHPGHAKRNQRRNPPGQ